MPPRNRILLERRERIIRAFKDVHEDNLIFADTIRVNKSTARSTVTRYVREGRIAERPPGGPNHVRVDNEMRDCLNDILNENCLLTLAQIDHELRQRLPGKPRIHDHIASSIYSRMKNSKFTQSFNVFAIKTAGQIGLHVAKPLSTFSCSCTSNITLQYLQERLFAVISKCNPLASCLLSVIHLFLELWAADACLFCRF